MSMYLDEYKDEYLAEYKDQYLDQYLAESEDEYLDEYLDEYKIFNNVFKPSAAAPPPQPFIHPPANQRAFPSPGSTNPLRPRGADSGRAQRVQTNTRHVQ